MKRSLAQAARHALSIRYEDGAWPLWRVDQSLRYELKARLQTCLEPAPSDREHHGRMAAYLDGLTSIRRASGPRSVRIAAVGDLMWVASGWDDLVSPRLRTWLTEFDLRVANLETPLDPARPVPRAAHVRFNAPPSMLDPWVAPSVLSLVNNHALDQGIDGLRRTREVVLGRTGLVPVGGVDAEEACAALTVSGVKLAFVGFTYGINPWGHGVAPARYPAGIPRVRLGSARHATDWDAVARLLAMTRATAPDVVVVLAHWGYEYELWPDARMREDAYRLVEMGADVVLGSSPHVLQPVEVVSVDGWDRQCPVQLRRGTAPRAGVIAFSLGNFTGALPTVACRTGAVLGLRLSLGPDGRLDVDGLDVRATVSARRGPLALGRQTILTEELAPGDEARVRAVLHLARLRNHSPGEPS